MKAPKRVFTKEGAMALRGWIEKKQDAEYCEVRGVARPSVEEYLAKLIGVSSATVHRILEKDDYAVQANVRKRIEEKTGLARDQFEQWTKEINTQQSRSTAITGIDHYVTAWRQSTLRRKRDFLSSYYEGKVPLFAYPFLSSPQSQVPLYVREKWTTLDDDSLILTRSRGEESPFQLNPQEVGFLQTFHRIRSSLGLAPIFDGKLFRLIKLEANENNLRLIFTKGTFFPCAACQYSLEHELNMALLAPSALDSLPLRDEWANSANKIESFCEKKAVRIGISNLLLLRVNRSEYKPYVQRRMAQSMVLEEAFDCVTSGFFDYRTDPGLDFDPRRKVLTEVGEELFGKDYLARPFSGDDAKTEEAEDWRERLTEMLDSQKTAAFHISGFCIDLIPMVPEIVTVFVVRDERYYKEFRDRFGPSSTMPEYSSFNNAVKIPRALKPRNLNSFMSNTVLREPDDSDSETGFDPLLWTMPGGFCFYQGLRRAVFSGLL